MKTTFMTGALIALSAALVACTDANSPAQTAPQSREASAAPQIPSDAVQRFTGYVISADRANIGTVFITNTPSGINAVIDVEGLSPGPHGMHFHQVGDCSDAGFKLSGGHINPMNKQHGLLNTDGPDNADMPNLDVGADGKASQAISSPRLSLNGEDGRPALLDIDGSALVIHANEDDQISQPIGGAGSRIACAVIKSAP